MENNSYHNESGRFGAVKSDSTDHCFGNACTKSGSLRFSVFRLLTDFVCLYTYEFWLSLCKIDRSSVILLLPLFIIQRTGFRSRFRLWSFFVWPVYCFSFAWWLLIILFFSSEYEYFGSKYIVIVVL